MTSAHEIHDAHDAHNLTVIVPTFNRRATLRLCLQALERQTATGFQVIVVDDGSTDGTADELLAFQGSTPLRLLCLRQPNGGPARGRNLALAQATTPFSLLIGDDILASPTLIEAHLRFHRSHPEPRAFALGLTRWDDTHQRITPFMRWYEEVQFDYRRLLAGAAPTWQHAYTSNLSFKTQVVRDNPFDERFRDAAWEDIELAFRLHRAGLFSLTLLPEAFATHVHPTTFAAAIRRMGTLGRNEHLFHSLQPSARPPTASDTASLIVAQLAKHPHLLGAVAAFVGRLAPPGKAHSMCLRAYQQLAYKRNGDGKEVASI